MEISPEQWPSVEGMKNPPIEVWRSKEYLLQVFHEADGIERMTVCRTSVSGNSWKDNIPWDDLQRLKRECGRANFDAVEVYPRDCDIVNVASMRHIFILPGLVPFAWRKIKSEPLTKRTMSA